MKILLSESECDVAGLKFWGSAASPSFCNWAHNYDRGQEIRTIWGQIPDDVDVLLTHGPPWTIGDYLPADQSLIRMNPHDVDPTGEHKDMLRWVGCQDLLERVKQLENLKLHVFGHIHYSNNIFDEDGNVIGGTYLNKTIRERLGKVFVNASICTEGYNPKNKPILVEV